MVLSLAACGSSGSSSSSAASSASSATSASSEASSEASSSSETAAADGEVYNLIVKTMTLQHQLVNHMLRHSSTRFLKLQAEDLHSHSTQAAPFSVAVSL